MARLRRGGKRPLGAAAYHDTHRQLRRPLRLGLPPPTEYPLLISAMFRVGFSTCQAEPPADQRPFASHFQCPGLKLEL
jgi:hypothetical protein